MAEASRNLYRGGRPPGTTDANARAAKLERRKATNWVVTQYAEARSALVSTCQSLRKRAALPAGTRESLVARAIAKFNIVGTFDVPRSTICSRMRADHLEVWQSGFVSPLIFVEVMLVAYIIQAWSLNCPLSISKTICHGILSVPR